MVWDMEAAPREIGVLIVRRRDAKRRRMGVAGGTGHKWAISFSKRGGRGGCHE